MPKSRALIDKVRTEALRRASAPEGFRATEMMPEYAESTIGRVLIALESEGLVYRAILSHRHVRWFGTLVASQQWIKSMMAKRVVPGVTVKRVQKGWGPDDPVHYPQDFKVTVCPGPKLDGLHSGWGVREFNGLPW